MLLKACPTAKRVHGIKGIHQAHIEAAKVAKTNMFWVVDADARILPQTNRKQTVTVREYTTGKLN